MEMQPRTAVYHPKSISCGMGIVPYAPWTITTTGTYCPEGWVLPGGARTSNEVVARDMARQLDAWIRKGET